MGRYAGQRRQTLCVCGWIKFALLGVIFSVFFQGVLSETEPTESQCRSYIEKALKEQHHEIDERNIEEEKVFVFEQEESPPTDELTDATESSKAKEDEGNDNDDDNAEVKGEDEEVSNGIEDSKTEEDDNIEQDDVKVMQNDDNMGEENSDKEENAVTDELVIESTENESKEQDDNKEDNEGKAEDQKAEEDDESDVKTDLHINEEDEKEKTSETVPSDDDLDDDDNDDQDSDLENPINIEIQEIKIDNDDDDDDDDEDEDEDEDDVNKEDTDDEDEDDVNKEDTDDDKEKDTQNDEGKSSVEEDEEDKEISEGKLDDENETKEKQTEEGEKIDKDDGDDDGDDDHTESVFEKEKEGEGDVEESSDKKAIDGDDEVEEKIEKTEEGKIKAEGPAETEAEEDADQETPEEEELINEMVIPENLRPRDHIDKILKLEDSGLEMILEKTIDTTLKALKGLYDSAIKPLEMLYKYRDLSNRHFGDPEIFSKPLILFMGPWSGGKSSTINYLLDNEFSRTSLRTGAEPSPAYFNILMHGEEEEILDGTQLAADWTFSGLQKFGQTLLDRLKGIKLPNKLLEKVNIVEIPGILEIRKQVQRLFPFNDACQWFIDRADIIFLVYDPSKLDVGPETEAILDQLKGREYQTRIILNKADQVKPEELMRVQGTLIWNISPLMSSSEPPIMYSTSLWSLPYEVGAPTRLLQAQERAFLRDLREAIDKRVENKIASARRFAVRVRNHAKMVDCYLTTYYNHKTIFGNKKKISDDIIEYPQKYHIYEGLSTLTNISRYDLPDPDAYRDFFKINPLYEFKKLSETCTYFRGCPINKLDVAIAYDLPELVGKYKKAVETAKEQLPKENS